VLGEGRRTGVHSLCEGGGLAACGDDVAQDLQLRKSRSHRRADAQLAFLQSSSRTSIPTTLIFRRPCPPVDPVGIFPPAPPASAGLHLSSPFTSTRPSLCRDHTRWSQAHSHRDSDWGYAFSFFLSFTVSSTTRSPLLFECHVRCTPAFALSRRVPCRCRLLPAIGFQTLLGHTYSFTMTDAADRSFFFHLCISIAFAYPV